MRDKAWWRAGLFYFDWQGKDYTAGGIKDSNLARERSANAMCAEFSCPADR